MKKRLSFIDFLVVINIMFITTTIVAETFLGLINPLFSTFFVFFKLFIITLLLLYQVRHYGFNIKGKAFVVFLLIYTCYLFYYIFVNPQIRPDDIKAAPHLIVVFLMNTYLLFGLMLCSDCIVRHFNLKLYIYLSFFVCTLVSFVYVETLGIEYILAAAHAFDEDIISPMGIAYANAPVLALSLTNMKSLHSNKFISVILAVGIALIVGYLLLIIGERGPMLWPIVAIATVYFFKNKLSFKYILLLVIVIIVVALNFDFILEKIEGVSDNTAARIEETLAGESNGRTDDDGTFVRGLQDFEKSPIFGHYFRITNSASFFYGHFPHNMFIEILMTMGIIGIIPYIILLIKAASGVFAYFRKRQNEVMVICLVFFLLVFFQLQVSSTIVFNYQYWLFFYILYNIQYFARNEVDKLAHSK